MLLDGLFSNKSKILIIRELVKSGMGITISQLAQSVGISKMQVSRIIKELSSQRIIETSTAGNTIISRINSKSHITGFIKNIFEAEKEFEEGLLKEIEQDVYENNKEKGIVSIILFGSRARKENKISSDFDIMVITETGKKENKNIAYPGFDVSLFFIPGEEFIKDLRNKSPLIVNVFTDGKILKGGKRYEELIKKSGF